MKTCARWKPLLNDAFAELGLLVGGVAATYGLDDAVVEALMRNVERLWKQTMERFEREGADVAFPATDTATEPHPAVSRFLQTLQSKAR